MLFQRTFEWQALSLSGLGVEFIEPTYSYKYGVFHVENKMWPNAWAIIEN